MEYEVYIDKKNENSLYTASMLSAMLENGTRNYLDLLALFVLYSLPNTTNSKITVDAITDALREFGFKDFPHKTTERILDRLCKPHENGIIYVRSSTVNKKRAFSLKRIKTLVLCDKNPVFICGSVTNCYN